MAKEKAEAAQEIPSYLFKNKGFWKWSTMEEEGKSSNWYVRTPKDTLPSETWLGEENIQLIHVCNPEKLMEAVRERNKEELAKHSSYCDNDYNCIRCKAVPNERVMIVTGKR